MISNPVVPGKVFSLLELTIFGSKGNSLKILWAPIFWLTVPTNEKVWVPVFKDKDSNSQN